MPALFFKERGVAFYLFEERWAEAARASQPDDDLDPVAQAMFDGPHVAAIEKRMTALLRRKARANWGAFCDRYLWHDYSGESVLTYLPTMLNGYFLATGRAFQMNDLHQYVPTPGRDQVEPFIALSNRDCVSIALVCVRRTTGGTLGFDVLNWPPGRVRGR